MKKTKEYILGIHILGHDLSVCVIDNLGEICLICQEERYSKIKGGRFVFTPTLLLSILKQHNIKSTTIRFVSLVGDPTVWSSSSIEFLSYNLDSRTKHRNLWLDEILKVLPNVDQVFNVRHHLAHAASAYYSSPWSEAAVLTMDAYGDDETATLYSGVDGELSKKYSVPFPNSYVYLYEAIAHWLGLGGKEKAGKLMGLSAYGKPNKVELLEILLDNSDEFRLAKSFQNRTAKSRLWVSLVEETLGAQRPKGEDFTTDHLNIACSIQRIFEFQSLKLVSKAKELVGFQNLCLAGGGVHNSVCNGEIQRSELFEHYFFHPLAGDEGLSLGAAQYVANQLGWPKTKFKNAFLGDSIDIANVESSFPSSYAEIIRFDEFGKLAEKTAQLISEGELVGWCQNRAESGPRALGNRSILADPTKSITLDRLNQIKNRESWRPFASSILEEDLSLYYHGSSSYPFMNVVVQGIKDSKLSPTCHVDGTTRIHTVRLEQNDRFYGLLQAFKQITGVGALINTSLNIQGKPIAQSEQDCVNFFYQSDIKYIVIGNNLIKKHKINNGARIISQNLGIADVVQRLPQKFNALILLESLAKPMCVNFLKSHALQSKNIDSLLALGLGDDGLRLRDICDYGKEVPLIISIPWYIEVFKEMLPNLFREISFMTEYYSTIYLLDLEGKTKIVDSDLRLETGIGELVLTEVEEHYATEYEFQLMAQTSLQS